MRDRSTTRPSWNQRNVDVRHQIHHPSWIGPAVRPPAIRKLTSLAPAPPLPPPPPPPEPAVMTEIPAATVSIAADAAKSDDHAASTAEIALQIENARLQTQVDELQRALEHARHEILIRSEPELVQLAVVIADRIVAAELRTNPAIFSQWVREAVGTLSGRGPITLAAAPDVAAELRKEEWPANCAIRSSSSVPPGACEVQLGATVIEVSARARMESVIEALEGDES